MTPRKQFHVYPPGSLGAVNPSIPKLYHYTSPPGFIGMLESKSLWFSNIRDQNDTEELTHALNLINDVIDKEYPSLARYGSIVDRAPIYTCSLSSAKDLLSQWRGYCHDGGYCYSIQEEQLTGLINKERLMLAKCIYDDSEQREFIKQYILGISPEDYKQKLNYPAYRQSLYPGEPLWEPQHPIIPGHSMHSKYRNIVRRNVATYAPVIKHPAFAEEQEWRLVTVPDYRNEPNFGGIYPPSIRDVFPYTLPYKTRTSGDRTIEYVVMPLSYTPDSEVLLSEVIISPTRHKEAAKTACEQLMQKHGNVIVTNSAIPYRNW